jgi:hypothetical protein
MLHSASPLTVARGGGLGTVRCSLAAAAIVFSFLCMVTVVAVHMLPIETAGRPLQEAVCWRPRSNALSAARGELSLLAPN